MSSYLEVQLDQQPIELCKLLKVADLVGGGGEAKVAISEGYVVLNGEVEFQKRKKVYNNDVVEFNGEVIQVIVDESLAEQIETDEPSPPSSNVNQASSYSKAKERVEEQPKFEKNSDTASSSQPKRRKPISF